MGALDLHIEFAYGKKKKKKKAIDFIHVYGPKATKAVSREIETYP